MRVLVHAVIGVLTLTTAGVAAADDMGNMQGMAMSAAPSAKQGHGKGVVKGVDAKAGMVTIQHGAIPEIGWPAMTMSFRVDHPSLLNGLKPGDHVRFTLRGQGSAYEVTAIQPDRGAE